MGAKCFKPADDWDGNPHLSHGPLPSHLFVRPVIQILIFGSDRILVVFVVEQLLSLPSLCCACRAFL